VLELMGLCDNLLPYSFYMFLHSLFFCNRIFMTADRGDRLSNFMNKKVTAKRMYFLQLTSA
jgi:hypothetical protein